MDMWTAYLSCFISIVWLMCTEVGSADVTCMNCQDVASPHDCNTTVFCGRDEICYTREFTNHRGQQGFHLGCELRTRCNNQGTPVIGRRERPDPAAPKHCYRCCSTSRCNTGLCKEAVVKTTPTSLTQHNTGNSCPKHFTFYKDNCYLFSSKARERPEAASYCWGFGANLTSIESQDEQDFVVKEIKTLHAPFIYEFWLGGRYEELDEEWQWFDGTAFNFTNWVRGQTPHYLNTTHYHHYAVIGNPDWITAYKNAPWISTARIAAANRGVICKMPHE